MKQTKTASWARVLTVMVAVTLIMALLLCGCDKKDSESKSGPEGIAEEFCEAYWSADVAAIMKMIPKEVLEVEIGDKDDQKEAQEEMEEELEYMFDMLDEYYDDWSVKCKVIKAEELDEDDLEEAKEYYAEDYGCELEDAREVKVEMTAEFDGESETEETTIYVVQIGSEWYIDMASLGAFG